MAMFRNARQMSGGKCDRVVQCERRNLRRAIPLDSPFSVEIGGAQNLPELKRPCFV